MKTEETVFYEDCRRMIDFLDTCPFAFGGNDRFFVKTEKVNGASGDRFEKSRRAVEEAGLLPAIRTRAISGSSDFGHTAPDFETAIKLGIPGIIGRIRSYAELYSERIDFYKALLSVWEAVCRFISRAADAAQAIGKSETAAALRHQLTAPPATLYEGFQLILILYVVQQSGEQTHVRTLGRIDSLLSHFADAESAEDTDALIRDFILEVEAFRVPANIPFALGGTDNDGNSLFTPFSERVLRVFTSLTVPHVKLHLLICKNAPECILRLALDSVRKGKNSIVLMSDETVIRSLEKLGEPHADAARYAVVGCYECGGYHEIACTCNGIVNIQKAVEFAMTGGVDLLTGEQIGLPFEKPPATEAEFLAEVERQLSWLCALARKTINLYEADTPRQHASPMMTSLYGEALERGKDVYADFGAKYNNSSINAIGLATAADSVFAVIKLVYRDRKMTLESFAELLKNDWAGAEILRLTVKNRFPKYGQGDAQADSFAARLVEILDRNINRMPNEKGGVFRLGTFSIDWRWEWGKCTSASADGRKAREVLSQNSGATFGQAKNGATAHLSSVASVGGDLTPNGSIVDLDFHASAVRGENGLSAMVTVVQTYFAAGGFAVHINVLDTDVLKEAKEHPEHYPDLQVRLCGWNVLFNALSEKEKAEFIRRSEEAV